MSESVPPLQPPPAPDRVVMLILSYLWFLALVPLVLHTPDPEVQWHAKHGLVLTVVEFAALFAWSILLGFVWLMTGGLFGCVTTIQLVMSPLIGLLILGFHIFLVIRALQGERVLVPYISDYANRF